LSMNARPIVWPRSRWLIEYWKKFKVAKEGGSATADQVELERVSWQGDFE
jgi:hypothetical protein